jgi:hypothetical protein
MVGLVFPSRFDTQNTQPSKCKSIELIK